MSFNCITRDFKNKIKRLSIILEYKTNHQD